MEIEDYRIFKGRHCETNAIGNLFLNIGYLKQASTILRLMQIKKKKRWRFRKNIKGTTKFSAQDNNVFTN
ncbi:MAG TPA: hypothetical protein DCQ26_05465 [Marinilabiliales bacterium]|nr:MAG: hypothetical protein A2W84_16470 [Bacteroidetes bacterium GWC2_40_13]OFX73972.1 MAG: hypothetical protein A2W96_11695 [Bacteroidetes bacterium GWD2_40_43]OFX93194.1 MAG: hypothetical protein A2W97_06375 [Bacteroidetes bacterium GWE2_40_63]OFY21564.1 MAG: hypothetical protein A2W88_10375 [Bacteroidetes bacterium GWF2_40_13]OFZ24217.1 MAG: hypothetical protein A2437_17510 [Bacteroidetes bacterium RIFOXYC2_FULL_40_12]HAM98038.1 hypothetical protein [Marinilabiliales bacterium]